MNLETGPDIETVGSFPSSRLIQPQIDNKPALFTDRGEVGMQIVSKVMKHSIPDFDSLSVDLENTVAVTMDGSTTSPATTVLL